MLIVESIFMGTLVLRGALERREMELESSAIQVVGKPLLVKQLSGNTLEYVMVKDIEKLPGVVSAIVVRNNDTFDVSVVMKNLEFDLFSVVAQKELELDSAFPQYTFHFDILPEAALRDRGRAL